jgi:hypothetical protein
VNLLAIAYVTCEICDKEFDSGFDVPQDTDLATNTSVCPEGHIVELTADKVKFS